MTIARLAEPGHFPRRRGTICGMNATNQQPRPASGRVSFTSSLLLSRLFPIRVIRVICGLLCFFFFVCGLPAAAHAADPGWVWWEAETPKETSFPKTSWLSPEGKEADLLSGGAWLSITGKRAKGGPEAFAVYEVAVPTDGEYSLWTRKFWKHGPFRWRFDDQAWASCGRDCALADNVTLRTHVGANWVYLGQVKLAKGARRFEIRLDIPEGEDQSAAFDCFALTRGVFVPNGKLKPGERSGKADDGFFAFEPPPDAFSPDAALDLRSLNEKSAGQAGFVKRKGDRFTLGDGNDVRFWAVNVGAGNAEQNHASVDYLARKLAKLGVNMVRFHSPVFSEADVTKADPKRLDDIFYLVAAMKKQGIYVTLSFYFPLWFDVKPQYGIEGYEKAANKKPFALLYFDPRMQEIHRSWAKALLTTKSPYTGSDLAQEPAVALVEIVNEDSLLFWTFSKANIPPLQWGRLEKLFGAWLAAKYGGVDKALAAWGGKKMEGDDPAGPSAGLFEAWHMTAAGAAAGGPDKRKRVADQVRFLVELQRGFYARTCDYLKKDLGYGGLVTASNWQTADPATLDALERYTYTACDVIDRHGYFEGPHTGEGASYSVRVGHQFADRSALLSPAGLPMEFNQVAGFPHIITEINWPNPNRYRAEATLLAAATGALQGVRGIYFFAVGSNSLADQGMEKFAVSSPSVAWTFPATALLYRRGDVAQGAPAVTQLLKLDDLFALKGERFIQAQALDELRKKDTPARPSSPKSGEDGDSAGDKLKAESLAYFVGPVLRSLDANAGANVADAVNLSPAVDVAKKTVRSLSGEVALDWGAGVLRVNTPRCKAAAGFLGKVSPIDLDGVTIDCRNEYASIVVISLDGLPIAQSKKVLIQAMTEERPFGFRAEAGKITDLGGPPIGVRKIQAKVTLPWDAGAAGAGAMRARPLDENAYLTGNSVNAIAGPKQGIELAPDAIYHFVER
jgi:hypothetical protein